MPFTGSHPAAVLPFMRTGLVPSALVIGSMAPDIPYFVPIPVDRGFSHSWGGIVTVDLYLALAVFVVWQALVAGAVLAIAPDGVRARLRPRQPAGLRHHLGSASAVALVAASFVVGGATHIVWDAFTHSGAWGPEHLPWLLEQHGPLRNYRYAQYASGLAGAAVLLAAAVHWWRTTPPDAGRGAVAAAADRRLSVAAWGAFVLAGVVAAAAAALDPLSSPWGADYRTAAFLCVTRGSTAAAVALLAFALVWAVWTRRFSRR